MDKKLSHLKALFLCAILITVLFSGCIEEEQKPEKEDIIKTCDSVGPTFYLTRLERWRIP